MLTQYFAILVFIAVGIGIGTLPIIAGSILGKRKPSAEKNSAYECGFQAFEDARLPFDVRYYLVAILFILFDLETAFLFPWAISFRSIGGAGLIAMAIFVGLLLIGFVYEWCKGALEWE